MGYFFQEFFFLPEIVVWKISLSSLYTALLIDVGLLNMSGASNLFKSTINEYLDNLPETVHSQLYHSPETCLAIFRLLPSLAKFYIMTLLFQETAIPYADLVRWVKQPEGSAHRKNSSKMYQNESIKRLKSLNLLKEIRKQVPHPATNKLTTVIFVQLNPIFRQSFRDALTGFKGGKPEGEDERISEKIEAEEDQEMPDVEAEAEEDEQGNEHRISARFLDSYCLSKWENILHFMVGSEIRVYPSVGVLTLLRYSGLMELPSDRIKRESVNANAEGDIEVVEEEKRSASASELRQLVITQNGFQFLLQDINSQIWALLLQYLKISEKLEMNPVDVLNFVFMLGSLELGEAYSVTMLSDTQMIMLEDLVDYGLIYYPQNGTKKGSLFYPTRLATSLTSENTRFKSASTVINEQITQTKNAGGAQGTVIIETNFKLYCYTTSPLQIAILNLFVHLRTRFSNMVSGVVTRDSIRRALINGITADQIISYLETHAHSGMIKMAEQRYAKKIEFENSIGNPYAADQLKFEVLPPTVIDQIKLWQLELDRIQAFKGYLYKDFAADLEFEKLLNYGEEIGVIIWKDRLKHRFFVTADGNQQLLNYANRILKK